MICVMLTCATRNIRFHLELPSLQIRGEKVLRFRSFQVEWKLREICFYVCLFCLSIIITLELLLYLNYYYFVFVYIQNKFSLIDMSSIYLINLYIYLFILYVCVYLDRYSVCVYLCIYVFKYALITK